MGNISLYNIFFSEHTPSFIYPLGTFISKQTSTKILEHIVPNKSVLDLRSNRPLCPSWAWPSLFSKDSSSLSALCGFGPFQRLSWRRECQEKREVLHSECSFHPHCWSSPPTGCQLCHCCHYLQMRYFSLEAKAYLLIQYEHLFLIRQYVWSQGGVHP